ncbi:MAG: hypothetical protein LUE96_12080 [Lachnospiraceae bacterium]|nr:hypothetical protein [Lachnospiraceae bacterium]
MINKHNMSKHEKENALFKEMSHEEQEKYFSFRKSAFMHNIDTFYYSVKFRNDFRLDTQDRLVKRFRRFFNAQYKDLAAYDGIGDFHLDGLNSDLVLKPVTFSRFYTICLSYPEYFDVFFAPVVPKAADGGESVTSEFIVQIRSYMLWMFGVRDAFENSYRYIKGIAEQFGLEIDFVQENRADYCWHSNFLSNPEKFFAPESFYKMRVDRFKNATYVTNKVGSEDYEIDYVALGKRSDKVFVRIYLKSREVIEQNYKPWFFKIWRMNGLISEYDLFVYERCFEKRNWFYRYYARLEFYLQHGCNPEMLSYVQRILSGSVKLAEDSLIALAEELTPPINLIVNVEYQTMRRHSKSYELIPFKDYTQYGECARVYRYIDNRKIIIDYLTNDVFRMVKKEGTARKSRRELCGFWEALRRTRCIDMRMTSDGIKLVRDYNRKLNAESMKQRVIYSAVTYGLYVRGLNNDSPMQDCFEALMRMNDNDVHKAMEYKVRKQKLLNRDELAGVYESDVIRPFVLLDEDSGVLYGSESVNKPDFLEDLDNDG